MEKVNVYANPPAFTGRNVPISELEKPLERMRSISALVYKKES